MNANYLLRDPSGVFSPGLLFYKEVIRHNIQHMLDIAGNPDRLRPHVKTHKTREISRMQLEAGIRKQKCATIAEAEMLGQVGVPDVLLAYNIVGPNCQRLAKLIAKYPGTQFMVLGDHAGAFETLNGVLRQAGQKVAVLLDLDVGQHRTGIAAGPQAVSLYETLGKQSNLIAAGFHAYDGHNHQGDVKERAAAVQALMEPVLALRATLEKKGLPVPRIVAGNTPTFPIYARMEYAGLECAPGTCVLHDHGYGTHFPDLSGFEPAALLLTRVISRPTPRTMTLDLGYKAVASDPPAGKRCILLDVPDVEPILQNEEHYVVATPAAEKYQPGDVVYALPTHICPTSALHRQAYVVEKGEVVAMWDIASRDRVLTV